MKNTAKILFVLVALAATAPAQAARPVDTTETFSIIIDRDYPAPRPQPPRSVWPFFGLWFFWTVFPAF